MLKRRCDRCRCLVHTSTALRLLLGTLVLEQVLALAGAIFLERAIEGAHVVLAVRDRLVMVTAGGAAPILRVGQVVRALIIELGTRERHLYQLERLVLDAPRWNVRHGLGARPSFETT